MADPSEELTAVENPAPPVRLIRSVSSSQTSPSEDSRAQRSQQGIASGVAGLATSYAVRAEQAARGRAMLLMALVVTSLSIGAVLVNQRRVPGHLLMLIMLSLSSVLSAVLVLVGRKRPLRSWEGLGFGVILMLTALTGVYYAGQFSPVVMGLFILVYFDGLGDSQLQSWGMFLLATIGYFALLLLAMTGLIDLKASVFPLGEIEPVAMIAMVTLCSVQFGAVFWLARFSRRATLTAMAQLERAQQMIGQREALLNEARADLHKALDAGRLGRFTGRDIGPYTVDEVIGRGAMGEVYTATERGTGAAAALKLLHPWVLDQPQLLERFFREAEIASALDSPHIVKVLGNGKAEDGTPYLAMELLEGQDLGWHLRESRRFGAHSAVELVNQVAQALGAAQAAGIVHRDLKPQNLFLVEKADRRVWKILDFGVSKIGLATSTLTDNAIVGTPSYMSPEQARGDAIDHRTDLFALGVIAYRVLTGRPAFTGENGPITMYNVIHVQPARPGALAQLDADVDLVLALAMAKDKTRRFSSASSFAAALDDALRGELDPRLRRDAAELLSVHDWGTDDTDRGRTRSIREVASRESELIRR